MSAQALLNEPIEVIARALRAGDVSALQLTDACLDRMTSSQSTLNAFISLNPEHSREAARAADEIIVAGGGHILTGIPIAHKDIFCETGWKTTAGSRMLENFDAPYDATLVRRLKEAGMITVGHANLDEFAMGSTNENSYFGPVRNPWQLDHVPGGSSGGSAAAVAAGLAPVASGTDTGGSIRQPASWCGVSGIKPTYGRISRYGMIAFASSLDQGGFFARHVKDLACLLSAVAGWDVKDATSVSRDDVNFTETLEAPLTGIRVGVPKEWLSTGLSEGTRAVVDRALKTYETLGATIVEISLPRSEEAISAYYVIAPAEASSNLSRYDGVRFGHRASEYADLTQLYERSRSEGFGREVKRRILMGAYVLSQGYYDAYYLQAQRVRRLIADDFSRAFAACDVIAGPVAPSTAFPLGSHQSDPVAMYLADIYTIPVNLAGLPAMSIPAGFDEGLPVGLQLIAPWWQESRLLNIAHQFQTVTAWHLERPEGFK
jgi:aspartyl-tRNA(Asn)/glutamyl-tRNA(Gln) amidotransferase subunit A